MDADFILLVTEPTPFGFYDLKLAHRAFIPLQTSMGVVVNRAGLGDRSIYQYCTEQNLPIVAEIPYRRRIAEAYAAGMVLTESDSGMYVFFSELADRLRAGIREVRVD